jgi:hypothetical protein
VNKVAQRNKPAKKLDARHAQRIIGHADCSLLAGESCNNEAAGSLDGRLGLDSVLDGDGSAAKILKNNLSSL